MFNEDPSPFYRFSKNLYHGTIQPSISHHFLALLDKQKILLRVYTQNIDGLEEKSGLPSDKVVNVHGSLNWAHCTTCHHRVNASEIANGVMAGTVPYCNRPLPSSGNRPCRRKRKSQMSTVTRKRRSTRSLSNGVQTEFNDSIDLIHIRRKLFHEKASVCRGTIKLGVTFFGEKLDDNVGKFLEKG